MLLPWRYMQQVSVQHMMFGVFLRSWGNISRSSWQHWFHMSNSPVQKESRYQEVMSPPPSLLTHITSTLTHNMHPPRLSSSSTSSSSPLTLPSSPPTYHNLTPSQPGTLSKNSSNVKTSSVKPPDSSLWNTRYSVSLELGWSTLSPQEGRGFRG